MASLLRAPLLARRSCVASRHQPQRSGKEARTMLRAHLARFAIALSLAAVLASPAALASAQDASPVATPAMPIEVTLHDKSGASVGQAIFTEGEDGVTIEVRVEGLTPGEHGWHLHAVGVCDPKGDEPFSSAGPHWNPTEQPHGGPESPHHHVGDFGNFAVAEDGTGQSAITTRDFTLGEGPTSVFDADGTAIIIHAGADDLTSQPSGNSGPRFACGVVAAPGMTGTPVPAAQSAATPAS
jgi:Cu-Zn family superoxide dismutase